MNSDEKIQLVWDRFVFQPNVFAKQKWNSKLSRYEFKPMSFCPLRCGTYPCEHAVFRGFTKRDIRTHLMGDETYGVYASKSGECKWLCIDVDSLDTSEVTAIVQRGIERFGSQSLLVEFSGSRGYHIWFFFEQPVPNERARALAHVLMAGKSHEVYPRQNEAESLGNLVKLPLGIQKKTGKRCWFVDETFTPYNDQWDALLNVQCITDLGPLPSVQKKIIRHDSQMPCISNMMTEGLHEGVRDRGLWRLGNYWRERSIPFDFALLLAEEVNKRSTPPLPFEQVVEKMQSAYARSYSAYPCQDQELDPYCSADCRFFKTKAEARGLSVERLQEQVRKS